MQRTFLLGTTKRGGNVELEVELNGGKLSICASVWRPDHADIESGGQHREVLNDVHAWAGEWIKATAPRMVEVWERYHLNDMKAGTAEQEAYLRAYPVTAVYPVSYYDAACEALKAANLYEVPDPRDPSQSYRYGTAWLTEAIPAEVLAEIQGWLDAPIPPYVEPKPLAGFLERYGIAFKITSAPTRRLKRAKWEGPDPEANDATQWQCRFTRIVDRKRRTFVTPFTMGSAHASPPTAGQVLHCCAMDCSGYEGHSFAEWASEYGYEEDSRKAEGIYWTIEEQARELRAFLGSDGYAELLAGEGAKI